MLLKLEIANVHLLKAENLKGLKQRLLFPLQMYLQKRVQSIYVFKSVLFVPNLFCKSLNGTMDNKIKGLTNVAPKLEEEDLIGTVRSKVWW